MLRHCHSPRESPRRTRPFLRSPPMLASSLLFVRFFADLFFFLFFPSSSPLLFRPPPVCPLTSFFISSSRSFKITTTVPQNPSTPLTGTSQALVRLASLMSPSLVWRSSPCVYAWDAISSSLIFLVLWIKRKELNLNRHFSQHLIS